MEQPTKKAVSERMLKLRKQQGEIFDKASTPSTPAKATTRSRTNNRRLTKVSAKRAHTPDSDEELDSVVESPVPAKAAKSPRDAKFAKLAAQKEEDEERKVVKEEETSFNHFECKNSIYSINRRLC